jgi:hypothetical protein
MKIIPSVLVKEMAGSALNNMAREFEYFVEDLPHPGSFNAELLQWLVSTVMLKRNLILIVCV